MKQFKKGDEVRLLKAIRQIPAFALGVVNYNDTHGSTVSVSFGLFSTLCHPDQLEHVETDLTQLDVPFGELDRATQLRLVEHVLDGGELMIFNALDQWIPRTKKLHVMSFMHSVKYRAARNEQALHVNESKEYHDIWFKQKPRIDVEKLEVKAAGVAKSLEELVGTIQEIKQCLSKS